jgi:two-component system cell cycle sensor histidine kinase/response regulator CckA
MSSDTEEIARLRAELLTARGECRRWEERHQSLADHSRDVVSCIDTDGAITYVASSVRTVLGYEPDELVGQNAFDLLALEPRTGSSGEFDQVQSVVAKTHRKDGTDVWLECWTQALRDADGRVTGFQSTWRDVTARRAAEEALKLSQRSFEEFVQSMPVPAIIHRDTFFTLTNRAFADVFGYAVDELLGTSIFDVVDAGDRAYIAERVKLPPLDRGGTRTREHYVRHKDGTRIPIEVTTVPVILHGELCRMGVIHDLRQRKHLEAQLITADRMASLGRLSAAVGHEINNPLTYVVGSLSLIDRELEQLGVTTDRVSHLRELLGNVREGAERIRGIVTDLKALSREKDDSPTPTDLGHVLDLCAAMADHEIRHRARLVKDYAAVPFVLGSEARLGQVFLNLLVNAAQSIAGGDVEGNEVRIIARPLGDVEVAVEISDTGVGIPPEVASKIFEPFFTTKADGGTGLGLSISRHLVTSFGGSIAVEPNQPRGTRFRVVLARASAARVAVPDRRTASPQLGTALARILVVDDEPQLATTIARLLARHTVEIASSGRAAIARLRRGERYDVMLCDLQMNDGSGMDVYEHLKREGSDLAPRMIFMTGGAVGARAQEFVLASDCPVLDKPFDRETLEAAVHEASSRLARSR